MSVDQVRPSSDPALRALTGPEIRLLEEIRLAGNHFFKKQQYRDAELLYRSGLGLMALGPEGMSISYVEDDGESLGYMEVDSFVASSALTLEDNRRAATLFLNLAQTLLNVPIRSERATAAALEAATICSRVQDHLSYIQSAISKDQSLAELFPMKDMRMALSKALTRKAAALERLANPAGAMRELMRMAKREPTDEMRLEKMEMLLRKFNANRYIGNNEFPSQLWDTISRSMHCHHSAMVTVGELENKVIQKFAQGQDLNLGAALDSFCCGSVKDGTAFVTRFSTVDKLEHGSGSDRYVVIKWGKHAGEVTMFFWGVILGDPLTPYTTGVVFRNCLFWLSATKTDAHIMCLPLKPNGSGMTGANRKIDLEFPDGEPLRRATHLIDMLGKLVVCGDALYLFGGNYRDQAYNDLLQFAPKYREDGSVASFMCQRIHPEAASPAPRWGHATFVHGDEIFIFGGTDGSQDEFEQEEAFQDMYSFNVVTKKWRIVDCYGNKPCARSGMGVATDGDRAVIVGGWTNPRVKDAQMMQRADTAKYLWLADVWEYHAAENCWIQVMPADARQAWLSGRQSPACGLVGTDALLTLGGFGPGDKDKQNLLGKFTYQPSPSPALGFHTSLKKQGPWRDLAVERACSAAVLLKPNLASIPEKLQELHAAPAGSVTLFATDPADTAGAVFTPSNARKDLSVLPCNAAFSPALETPLRPLAPQILWGSQECPFELAPRWLTAPAEVSTNLAGDGGSLVENYALAVRHTVKQFGTAKAAVEYFRLCQPHIAPKSADRSTRSWRRLSVFDKLVCNVDELLDAFRDAPTRDTAKLIGIMRPTEISCFHTSDASNTRPTTGVMQLYLMIVCGPVFACVLSKHRSIHVREEPNEEMLCELCFMLVKLQQRELLKLQTRANCIRCGAANPSARDVEEDPSLPRTKVCRGCHLVRYCSAECQRSDWPAHREVCKKYAAPGKSSSQQAQIREP